MAMACLIINIFLFSGCRAFLELPVGMEVTADTNNDTVNGADQYNITDYDIDTSDVGAVEINLDSLKEEKDGTYTYCNECLTICEAGTYILNGSLNSGNLVVNVYDDEVVHLILNNVEIRSDENPAILIEKADKVIITVAEGTESIVSDSTRCEGKQDACIFSNSDLTINGSGTLFVYGYHADGVRSKDQLKIVNTTLSARAKSDGVRGNDGVIIWNSATDIECEGSGIVANGDKDMVVIQGGSCKVIAGEYAIFANRYVAIHDCLPDLYSVLEPVRCNGIRDFGGEYTK